MRISDHAVHRYAQRVLGLNTYIKTKEQYLHIKRLIEDAIGFLTGIKTGKLYTEECIYVIKRYTLVTVLRKTNEEA